MAAIILVLLLTSAAGLRAQASPGQAAPPANAAAVLEALQSAIETLQAEVADLDPSMLQVSRQQKRILADSQASLQRNLSEAAPGLMQGFRAAPDDTGAAFRLYRDLDAVLGVAQRSADAGARALTPGASALRDSLDQLGNWIEATGSANFTELSRLRAAQSAKPAPPPPPPPPPLVIDNANGVATPNPKAKPPAKKPCCG